MTRVLYVHGLESGPRGRKVRQLAEAGFQVVSHQMPCGRAQVARDPAVLAAAAGALAALGVGATLGGGWGLAGAGVLVAAGSPVAGGLELRRVLRRSVEVQLRALAEQPVEVVVGSSFGGAVALELLRRGAWAGPTVLLCPAHALVARKAGLPTPPSLAALPEAVAAKVLVVHGRQDQTVPLADSEALVAGSRARLVRVDDDHRLSATATAPQLAAWVAQASAGPA